MTLSEELSWRGFVNQTTYKDITVIDGEPITFYWGVDPSADSMQVGNFAIAMMIRHFMAHGHKAVLLVGGATGLIGDPDGKNEERELQSVDTIAKNKAGITAQYQQIFNGMDFTIVDNYDWFKDMGYLNFLREVGKHVPMRAMLGREFVSSRLGEEGAGISYAEFSYSLIQGYDFLHLHRNHNVSLQVCGADQWGNSIAGVDLVRRITGDESHIWSAPLIINKSTGIKFGKSESGTIWLDSARTSPTQFYQFWINCDDAGVSDYLKIYTLLSKDEIESLMSTHQSKPSHRRAQKKLAHEVTRLVHGEDNAQLAQSITDYLTGNKSIDDADEASLRALKSEIKHSSAAIGSSIVESLVATGLAASISEGRRLMDGKAISVNGNKISSNVFEAGHFLNGRLLLRRGKAFKDTALIEEQ